MSQGEPSAVQQPAEVGDGYHAMVASMQRHLAYVRDRALAMAGQQTAYEEGLAADAALKAARNSMAAPVSPSGLPVAPATAWDLVHHRGMSARSAASRLGIRTPALLELLAEHKPVAEAQEARMLQASDAAHMYGGHLPR